VKDWKEEAKKLVVIHPHHADPKRADVCIVYKDRRRSGDICLSVVMRTEQAEDLLNSIASALQRAAKVSEGCVRLPDGTELAVLGDLPIDKKCRVIGTGMLWTVHCGEILPCRMALRLDRDGDGNNLAFEVDDAETGPEVDELHDLCATKDEAASLAGSGERGK
jgi:hypothetical protein